MLVDTHPLYAIVWKHRIVWCDSFEKIRDNVRLPIYHDTMTHYSTDPFIQAFRENFNYDLFNLLAEREKQYITFKQLFGSVYGRWTCCLSADHSCFQIYNDGNNLVNDAVIDIVREYAARFADNGTITYRTLMSPEKAKGCLRFEYHQRYHITSAYKRCCQYETNGRYIFIITMRTPSNLTKSPPLKRSRTSVDEFAQRINHIMSHTKHRQERNPIISAWSDQLCSTYVIVNVFFFQVEHATRVICERVIQIHVSDKRTVEEFGNKEFYSDSMLTAKIPKTMPMIEVGDYRFRKELYYRI
jgi:hypothetical protein